MTPYKVGYLARKHGLELSDLAGSVPPDWLKTFGFDKFESAPYNQLRQGFEACKRDEIRERLKLLFEETD